MGLLSDLWALLTGRKRPPPPPEPPDPPGLSRGWRPAMLSLLNLERAGRAGPLALDHALSLASQAHSQDMAGASTLYHAPFVNEVIAAGQRSPAEAVDSWMASGVGHRQMLLDPRWRHVGFGAAQDRGGTWYWTARFR